MALVGRDVLFGCAAGVLVQLLDLVPMALSEWAETASSYIGLPIASPAALFGEVISTATGGEFRAPIHRAYLAQDGMLA